MKIINKIALLIFVSLCNVAFSQSNTSFFEKADSFFKEYVVNGKVNYTSLKKNSVALNELVELISSAEVLENNVKEYQAFYINAYNISVIKGITTKYPVKSPLNIAGFFDAKKHVIAGKKITLNSLENDYLRKVFPKEPRFHFVLVCAGLGCPPIISEAYTPSRLETQLERQTKLALNDPNFIKVNGNKVKISQIFEWYKKDFTQFGKLKDFINKYRKNKLPEKGKLGYYTYNWTLNKI